MIKGLILGITIALFLTSSIITIAGISDALEESIITGAVIGTESMTTYAIIALVLSLIGLFVTILIIRKSYKKKSNGYSIA